MTRRQRSIRVTKGGLRVGEVQYVVLPIGRGDERLSVGVKRARSEHASSMGGRGQRGQLQECSSGSTPSSLVLLDLVVP